MNISETDVKKMDVYKEVNQTSNLLLRVAEVLNRITANGLRPTDENSDIYPGFQKDFLSLKLNVSAAITNSYDLMNKLVSK